MGILDDLKKEADSARIAKEQAELRKAELQAIYLTGTCPAMLRIHHYLSDLVEQLAQIPKPIVVDFDVPGIGRINKLIQTNYRVFIDNHKTPRLIQLSFECTTQEEKRYKLTPKSAGEEARQFLTSQNIMFSDWALRDENREVIGLTIQCKFRILVSLTFKADVANEGIRVLSHNFEKHGEKNFLASYQSIDDNWLDKLGHYILRKDDSFGRLDISEEQRNQLRKRLAEEGRNRPERRVTEDGQVANTHEKLLLRLGKIFGKNKP